MPGLNTDADVAASKVSGVSVSTPVWERIEGAFQPFRTGQLARDAHEDDPILGHLRDSLRLLAKCHPRIHHRLYKIEFILRQCDNHAFLPVI